MCDCEIPSAFFKKQRRARVAHECCECGEAIKPGDVYEYVSGVWDGRGESFKTCTRCAGVREFYKAEMLTHFDCGPCFGQLWDDMQESERGGTMAQITADAQAAGYLTPGAA